MLDESKAIQAKDIVADPDSVYGLTRSHILVGDSSANATFSNLMDAINILADAGWEVINTTYNPAYMHMFVMLRNPNYKRKNREV